MTQFPPVSITTRTLTWYSRDTEYFHQPTVLQIHFKNMKNILFSLPTRPPFPVLLIPGYRSGFTTGIIFCLHEGLPLNIACWVDLLVMNSFSFCMFVKVIILPLILKDTVTCYRVLGWQVFFFKDAASRSHGLHCFQQQICSLCSPVWNVYFFFFMVFYHWFEAIWWSCALVCFRFLIRRVHWAFWIWVCFHQVWETFGHYFSEVFFCSPFNGIPIRQLNIVPQLTGALSCFVFFSPVLFFYISF